MLMSKMYFAPRAGNTDISLLQLRHKRLFTRDFCYTSFLADLQMRVEMTVPHLLFHLYTTSRYHQYNSVILA